ncbi:MAG: HAMP domain-containing histidine kinase [Anaerolineaceae bacterium]|nr:HAMP domain-containing histidine kinase [Anaerolineaceae bacterium]
MWADIEHSIRTILDTMSFLDPVSVRVVLNKNTGHAGGEDLRLYSIGKTGNAFENVDSMFYGIMRSQKTLKIPSIHQSNLFSNLFHGEGGAVFFPLNSRFGYFGFIWACFRADNFGDKVSDSFTGCCEWAELLLQKWLESELSVRNEANQYVDLLERLNIPALIHITPDNLLVSNPSFEKMKDKESFLTVLRQDASKEPDGINRFSEFDYILKKMDFSASQSAKIYIFPHAGSDIREIRFGENEIQYYHLLTQKALGAIALLESSGDLTNLQKNYIGKTENPLKRMEELFGFGNAHYQRTENILQPFGVLSVTEIAREVVYDMAASARNKRVEIELDTEGGTRENASGNAVGDPWLLTLAIFDLLDNAIRFTPMDGKPINVRIAYNEKDWSLRVEDFGTGISPLDLERMQNLNYAEAAGSGLHGIALVKYVAKVHNGKLDIESRLGKGSVFTLTIPYYMPA